MSGINRGKQFEDVIKRAFESIEGVSIDRIHDQTTGFAGSTNVSDFIMYRYPYEWYLECKSCHGGTLNFNNITDNQRSGLLQKSEINGVFAGILVWFIDKDKTFWIDINALKELKLDLTKRSLSVIDVERIGTKIYGKKKRVFFDYDMRRFLDEF